jgi:hypothetical protein
LWVDVVPEADAIPVMPVARIAPAASDPTVTVMVFVLDMRFLLRLGRHGVVRPLVRLCPTLAGPHWRGVAVRFGPRKTCRLPHGVIAT